MHKLDIVGKRFGRLNVVKEFDIRTKSGKLQFECICDCGNKIITVGSKLVSNHTKSCSCIQKEKASKSTHSQTHKMSGTKTYVIWASMKGRCYNKGYASYSRYGGRGIVVCDRWKNSFENFYKDMGESKKGYSIERVDNNGNYEPSNCKWATQIEQENNKSTNRHLYFSGQSFTIAQLARKLNLKYTIVYNWKKCKYQQEKIELLCKKRLSEIQVLTS